MYSVEVFSEQGLTVANEDRYLSVPAAGFFAVFDGEFDAGRAADVAVTVFAGSLSACLPLSDDDPANAWLAWMLETLTDANSLALADARARKSCAGATALVVKVLADSIVVVSVGDSRLYARSAAAWTRATRDHSLSEDPLTHANVSETDRAHHSTVVTRVLGVVEHVEPFASTIARQGIDALLLCTDGAWRPFSANADRLPANGTPSDIIRAVESAWRADGKRDDASIIAVQLEDL